VKLLLDTQLLLWAATAPKRLSAAASSLIEDDDNLLIFSVVSIWETTIKANLGRADFTVNPRRLRPALLEAGYQELEVTSVHALAVGDLPLVHRDPFDRLLLAQAISEGLEFATADNAFARYPIPAVRLV